MNKRCNPIFRRAQRGSYIVLTAGVLLYQGTFRAPPPAVNVINIGGNIGANK